MLVRDARESDAAAWRAIQLEESHADPPTIPRGPGDAAEVAELVKRIAGAGESGSVYLAAEADGAVVGILGGRRGDRPATRHVVDLGITIAAAHRGRGIGRALMLAAEERARGLGVTKLTLGVFTTNARARALYEKLGYVEEGVRRGQYQVRGRAIDESLMAKRL